MSTIDTIRSRGNHNARPGSRIEIDAILGWLSRALERRRTRSNLLDLTDQQLADIGVSRDDARREAGRFF